MESYNKVCLNCRHWRDKAWVDKGWGICDNPKNEVRVFAGSLLNLIAPSPDDEWARQEIIESIRYPEDFGCIFFEPLKLDPDQEPSTDDKNICQS